MIFPLASALDVGQMAWWDHRKQVDPGQRPVKAIGEGGFWRSSGHCSALDFVCIASHTLQIRPYPATGADCSWSRPIKCYQQHT